MYIFLIYIVLLTVVSFFNNRGWTLEILETKNHKNWIWTGISLFMYLVSIDNIQLSFEVIKAQGLWGMWPFWTVMIGIFVVPLIFAPLWRRLNLLSDNDFTLFRFSGKGAKILYIYRAYYLGILIITLLLSFHVLAFSKLLSAYFGLDKTYALAITAILLLLFSIKTSYSIKIKTDVLHAVLYSSALIIFLVYIIYESSSLNKSIQILKNTVPHTLQVWPANSDQYFYAAILLTVHWWSIQLFDGSGPEMLRFRTAKDEKSAIKTGLLSIALTFISNLMLTLGIIVLLSIQSKYPGIEDFHSLVKIILPEWTVPIILLGWFSIFISTCESLLLWSASLWTNDFYKRIGGKKKQAPYWFIFISMFIISILSVISAYKAVYLQDLIKWLFSISAGVAPFFFLRWFVFRINAWTQLTAMAIIPFLNIFYSYSEVEKYFPYSDSDSGSYIWRVLILTVLCIIISLIVMFFTKKDDNITLERFKKQIPPFKSVYKAFLLAIVLGFLYFVLWNLLWTLLFSIF